MTLLITNNFFSKLGIQLFINFLDTESRYFQKQKRQNEKSNSRRKQTKSDLSRGEQQVNSRGNEIYIRETVSA